MKRILSMLWILLLTLFTLSACGRAAPETPASSDAAPNPEPDQPRRLSVVSTIFPGYDFTREIAGEYVDLVMLLPPGSESHSFEPTPKDIITIQNCDIFLYVGGESDDWVDSILESMDTSDIAILPMMYLVDVVEEEIKEGMEDDHDHDEDYDHDDHDHEDEDHDEDDHDVEYDEHVWTSPINAMRIVQAITDTLCELDDTNAPHYRDNAAAYLEQLEELDGAFREVTDGAVRRTLIFGDRFPFRYFVDTYGLDYYAAFPGCSTETEASAKTVAFLIDKVGDEGVPVVFHIEFSNEKMADTISENTGAKKRLLHSCHNVTKNEFEGDASYLSLMWKNIETLKEALN